MIKNIKNINRDNLATINSNCHYKPIRDNNIDTSLPNLNFNEYSANILHCTEINNSFPNPLDPSSLINVITVPPKFWRKNPVNKYNTVLYDDVDEDVYVFKSFGKSIKRSRHFTHRPRLELIIWNKLIDKAELVRDLNIGQDIEASIRQSIIKIVQDN